MKDFNIKLVRKKKVKNSSFYVWQLWKDRIIYALLFSDKPLTAHDIGVIWNKVTDIARHEWNKIEPICKELEEKRIINKTIEGYELNYEQFAFCFLSSLKHKGLWICSKDRNTISKEKIIAMANYFRTNHFKNILIKFLSKEDMAKAKHKQIGTLNEKNERILPLFKENIFERIKNSFDRFRFAIINPEIVKLLKIDMVGTQNFLIKEANVQPETTDNIKNTFYDKENNPILPPKELKEALIIFEEISRTRQKKYGSLGEFISEVYGDKRLKNYIDIDNLKANEDIEKVLSILNTDINLKERIKEEELPEKLRKHFEKPVK